MMISGATTAFQALRDSSERLEHTAQSIANGGPVHANGQAERTAPNKNTLDGDRLSTPASIAPDASPVMQLVDLKQTELVFKTSALAARTLIETSQDLMDALR